MGTSAENSDKAVRAVMERYVDAVYRADVDALRDIFHPDAFMGGYLGDDLLIGNPEPFLLDLGGRPSMAEAGHPYQAYISRVEVKGRAANATLDETGFFGSFSFVNYYGLLQVEGVWKIVSKTFTSL